MNKSTSPSRRYVAMCSKSNFQGYYFKSFVLPEKDGDRDLRNDTDMASWYFLNKLNLSACINGCMSEENFKDLSEQMSPASFSEV